MSELTPTTPRELAIHRAEIALEDALSEGDLRKIEQFDRVLAKFYTPADPRFSLHNFRATLIFLAKDFAVNLSSLTNIVTDVISPSDREVLMEYLEALHISLQHLEDLRRYSGSKRAGAKPSSPFEVRVVMICTDLVLTHLHLTNGSKDRARDQAQECEEHLKNESEPRNLILVKDGPDTHTYQEWLDVRRNTREILDVIWEQLGPSARESGEASRQSVQRSELARKALLPPHSDGPRAS